ncbi:universal stress protein [Dokdonella immobilis]|uniref:Universal stress protein family protein n=1 Tax=Dokdonella immobilis TaxID=578942 RepID=A0A1I4ZA63_9GAMM|nr:universal stress protein [Dokdonella immobilis]SFN47088.1 Universal stress protein family protein [Dokdonella immobilis]
MRDIILYIDSYPEPASVEAIDQAVRFAAAIDAEMTAFAVQVEINAPRNWLAERLISLGGLCAEEEAKSKAHCQSAIATYSEKLAAYGVRGDVSVTRENLADVGTHVALQARTRDLCLVPSTNHPEGQRWVAEAVVFQSGRPVILYRPGVADLFGERAKTAVVAWDGSRPCARAMADALPLLKRALQVRVLTVVNEKPEASSGLGAEVLRHLKLHGIAAISDEVDAAGRKIGQVLTDYVTAHDADLLVMGAYGRSKMREFILGGATDHMLGHLPAALFLSH